MKKILDFIELTEGLKKELRHSWLSNDRQESVAEHVWRMSMILLVIEPKLDKEIDMLKTLKMIIIHDLVEIYAGDIPVFKFINDPVETKKKKENEELAMKKLMQFLNQPLSDEIFQLWKEYENVSTYEAKVAKAIDKLEAQIQHNQSDLSTWEEIEFELTYRLDKYTQFDTFLDQMKDEIVKRAEDRYRDFGVNPEMIKSKL